MSECELDINPNAVNLIISNECSVDYLTPFVTDLSSVTTSSPTAFFSQDKALQTEKKYQNIYLLQCHQLPVLSILKNLSAALSPQGCTLIPLASISQYPHIQHQAQRLGYVCEESSLATCEYLVLRKERLPKWQFSIADSNDSEDIRALFLQVFQHELSPDMWRWKYANDKGVAVLGYKENELVSHYGGISRDIMISNQASLALQIGDVMVKSSERGLLTRNGLFFQTCSTFLEQYIGDNKPYQLGFGFPTRRAMDVANKQGLYRQVDHMVEMRWSALNIRKSLLSCAKQLNSTAKQSHVKKVNHLWQGMLEDFKKSIIGVRDWHYLLQRYLMHPEKKYHIYLITARLTGSPSGVVVLSHEGERCRLMDLVGPTQSFPMLIHHARRLAHKLGAQQLFGWVTYSHQQYFSGGEEHGLDICIPTNTWTQSSQVDQDTLSWWLTAGDTDFC